MTNYNWIIDFISNNSINNLTWQQCSGIAKDAKANNALAWLCRVYSDIPWLSALNSPSVGTTSQPAGIDNKINYSELKGGE